MNGREILSIIYNRFYLRDLFGKIIPGLVFIGVVYLAVNRLNLVPDINADVLLIIVLFGVSWVLGFCMQSFGEWIGLIRYYPKSEYKTPSKFYDTYLSFQAKASTDEKEDVERLVVIKEACGNLCSTLLVTGISVHLIIFNVRGFTAMINYVRSFWSLYIIVLFVFIFLLRMHRAHVNRQSKFMKAALSRKGEGNSGNHDLTSEKGQK